LDEKDHISFVLGSNANELPSDAVCTGVHSFQTKLINRRIQRICMEWLQYC